MKNIKTPLDREEIKDLKAGEMVTITGYIYTARDAVHQKWKELWDEGKEMNVDVKDQVIYYVGPSPAKNGEIIGSCGPTSAYRMDAYTPQLLDLGLAGIIGKGRRGPEVIESIIKNGAVYFTAIGGAAAVIKEKVKSSEIIGYEELGAEALRKLYVEEFPVTVTIDSKGNNLYEMGPEEYLKSLK